METKMLNIKINGRDYTVPYGTTVLEACKQAGIEIPTLCYLKDVNEIGACRLCLVEVVGARGLVTACVYPIEREGTEILTNTDKVKAAIAKADARKEVAVAEAKAAKEAKKAAN